MGKFTLNANYTNLDGKITSPNNNKDTTFFNLYRRPRQLINLQAGFLISKGWQLNAGVQSVGKRMEAVFGAPPIEMPAYYTWNIYSSFAINRMVKLFADFRNITDEQYQEVRGYNSRRFNFMAGLSLKF